MSRRSRAQRKIAEPDPIYNSRLVTLLVSRILQSGKKSLAQKMRYLPQSPQQRRKRFH